MKVSIEPLFLATEEMTHCKREIALIQEELKSIINTRDLSETSGTDEWRQFLRKISDRNEALIQSVSSMRDGMELISGYYRTCENRILDEQETGGARYRRTAYGTQSFNSVQGILKGMQLI